MKYLKYVTLFLPIIIDVVQRVEEVLNQIESDKAADQARTASRQGIAINAVKK